MIRANFGKIQQLVVLEHKPSDTRSEQIQPVSLNHNDSRDARATVVTLYIHDQAKTQNKRVTAKQMEIIYIWMIIQIDKLLFPRTILGRKQSLQFLNLINH